MRSLSHLAALLALLSAALLACGSGVPRSESAPTGDTGADLFAPRPDADLLLITIDTLRADAPGFAGGGAATPMLDRLAAEGRVFPRAHAQNVMTLPSHTNLLTGLYPYQHGVRENSGYTLPEDVPTLATLLREAGWATAAVVGAFPLDARFGLGRGFELYDDRVASASPGDVFVLAERPGTEVVARALEWWRAKAGQRRFLWVHLFEPHAPYAPPAPFAERYANHPYLGEVAAADAALAPLLTPILDGSEEVFVVFTSDHGEGLGDHGELTHGIFAYESTLKVPLVIWGPGIAAGIDQRLARHVDVLPTALAALGQKPPTDLPGRSLLGPVSEDSPTDSYFEALTGALARGWAPLRGTIHGSTKLVELPLPELYDLDADPEERTNLFDDRRDEGRQLAALLPTESQWPPTRGTVSPEVEAELRSLGYLGGSVAARQSYGPADDPKNLIGIDRKLHRINGLYAAGRLEDVVQLGLEILAERPNLGLAATYVAQSLMDLGRPQQAVEVLEGAQAVGAGSDTLLRQLGMALTMSGRAAEAVTLLEPSAERAGPATLNVLGAALAQSGQPERAAEILQKVFDVDPTNSRACQNLSAAAIARQRWSEAAVWAERALELDDKLPDAWNNLGVARYYLGDGSGALEAWQRALVLNPNQFDTLFNLGLKAAELGETELARRALGRFLETAPPRHYAPALEQARRLLTQLGPAPGVS